MTTGATPPLRVLVTGGTGFLGARVARSYVDSGAIVTVLGRRESLPLTCQAPADRVTLARVDLLELRNNTNGSFANQDVVIHAAAHIRARSLAERVLQRKVNVDGTQRVIEACRQHRVPRLVHVSTCAAIGIPQDSDQPADEQFVFNTEHLEQGYSLTKRAAEHLALAAGTSRLQATVVNPGYIFGWDNETYRGKEVIERVLRKPVIACTSGGLSIVHVDDVVDGIRLAAAHGRSGQRYILSGQNVSFREIAEIVCRASGRRKPIVSIPEFVLGLAARSLGKIPLSTTRGMSARLALLRDYSHQFYSSELAVRELGYQPRPFERVIADFFARGDDVH